MQRIRQEKIGPSSVGGATGTNSSGVGGTTALNQQQESSTANSSSATLPIVVIGAGAAGLMCANILKRYGLEVIVVEAQNYAGGRVKQLKGFVEWKDLDLGAEFVHGEKSILKGLIDQNGWPCRLLFTWAQGDGETPDFPVGGGISLYFLGKDKKLLRYDTDEPDVRKVNELLWNLWETKTAPGDKRTLEQYLKDNGASERCLSLAESGYANTLCSSLERLSLDGVAKLEAKWDKYGGGDYRLDNSMYQVIQHLTQDQDIRLEWPVRTINYEKDSVVLTSIHGEKIEASKVVVAVPLPVLKDEDVDFQPSLPQEKIRAIKTIGIDSAMKIVMKFSQRFWPSEVHGVICSESFLPEIWFEEPGRVGVLTPQSRPQPKQPVTLVTGNVNKNIITVITTTTTINNNTGETKTTAAVTTQPALTYLVSGFACSRNAERISQLSRQQIIDSMLSQLDTMFADKAAHKLLASDPHAPTPDPAWDETINLQKPASSTFLDCLIFDWGKQPYIKGGYSYPSPGATREVREDLARPIDDKIFFAGEATNPTSFMTLHGAMETGEFAAQAIIKSLPYTSNLKKSVKPLKSKL